MKESENLDIPYSGKSIAKNTIFNLFGYGIPLIFALVIIPFLIKGLGNEKFGILNLAWVIIGYFSFFDFGIGRAITQIIAEKIGTKNTGDVPVIFWTSFFMMLVFSLVGTMLLLFLAPTLVYNVFKITPDLQTETLNTFYLLTISIPIVTTTAGMRGVLEAYQKFGVINIIRTILGVFSFLGPLICLAFTNNLFWIVMFLVVVRIIIWALYMSQCFKLNSEIIKKINFNKKLVKPILKLSGWMTVSNIVVPVIVYLDRFLIGALVSAAAIAYYATPYEIVTKLLLIPGAITGVLFPAFSASYLNNPSFTKELSLKAVKYIFIALFPVILLIITFANEGMRLWLGQSFAENSTLILQLLAFGILFNSMAYIPFAYLQGIGRADLTAKTNLLELPFYLIAMWLAIKHHGINGAALVFLLRMLIDAIILFILAEKQNTTRARLSLKPIHFFILFLLGVSILPVVVGNIGLKFALIAVIVSTFILVSWKFLLLDDERTFLISSLKRLKS